MVKSCFESHERREDAVIPYKWITPGTHPSFHIGILDRPPMRQRKYSDSTDEVCCLELDKQPACTSFQRVNNHEARPESSLRFCMFVEIVKAFTLYAGLFDVL